MSNFICINDSENIEEFLELIQKLLQIPPRVDHIKIDFVQKLASNFYSYETLKKIELNRDINLKESESFINCLQNASYYIDDNGKPTKIEFDDLFLYKFENSNVNLLIYFNWDVIDKHQGYIIWPTFAKKVKRIILGDDVFYTKFEYDGIDEFKNSLNLYSFPLAPRQ